jgi:hypothetical protein
MLSHYIRYSLFDGAVTTAVWSRVVVLTTMAMWKLYFLKDFRSCTNATRLLSIFLLYDIIFLNIRAPQNIPKLCVVSGFRRAVNENIRSSWTVGPLQMGSIGCPETSLTNYPIYAAWNPRRGNILFLNCPFMRCSILLLFTAIEFSLGGSSPYTNNK